MADDSLRDAPTAALVEELQRRGYDDDNAGLLGVDEQCPVCGIHWSELDGR